MPMIIQSIDPLRAKKTFIRKKLGHTMVSAIKASSVTLLIWQKELEENNIDLQVLIMAVVSKTDISRKIPSFSFISHLVYEEKIFQYFSKIYSSYGPGNQSN